MLARVVLCLSPASLADRIQRLVDAPDVVFERVRGQRSQHWIQAMRRAGDLVVVSLDLVPDPAPAHIEGLRGSPDHPDVVVIVPRDDAEERSELLAAGAEEVLHRDVPDDHLAAIIRRVIARRREHTAERLRIAHPDGEPRLSDFASVSPAMQAFMDVVHRVVDSDSSLLLLGETGVGKERLARAIHAESPRSNGPFVAVNCGALPETLLESELFGHEKGAFTGAARTRRGWFELAHGGTVFLDEVGEMAGHLQVKLLRVLQGHSIQPLGSEREMRIDVRVMAASNRDLEAEVERGGFRRDLYYRLGVVTLEVPPLRHRREDIPYLLDSFVQHFAFTLGRDVRGISPAARQALIDHDWPGNVRELANVIERAVLLCEGPELDMDNLPHGIVFAATPVVPGGPSGWAGGVAPPSRWLDQTLREARQGVLDAFERSYLSAHLAETEGRIGETARRAGIQPRSLYEKMRRLGLRKEDFRPA
jgi:DNA-binding NtrC family response regulator